MNCNTTHYRANSSSVPGDPTAVTTAWGTVEANFVVPATVGGAAPRWMRIVPSAGEVVGDTDGLDVWFDEVRARKVVGTAEIADASIGRAKIGLLAVGDGQFETASIGKLTSGTLSATVLLSGLIRTATTGLRWEGDPGGIRFYNADGALTIRLAGASGDVLWTGTVRSAISGERWVGLPDGTFRFYPAAGANYSQLSNLGNDLMIRGPLDGNNRSGRINANSLAVGLNFSAESDITNNTGLRAEVLVLDRRVLTTAPFIHFRVDDTLATTDGQPRRVTFEHRTAHPGTMNVRTRIDYRIDSVGNPGFTGFSQDSGWKSEGGFFAVVNAGMDAFRAVNAGGFNQQSSITVKEEVEPIDVELDALATVRTAKARRYRYRDEKRRRPDDAPVRFGLIAEELPAVLVNRIPAPSGGGGVPAIDLASQLGVLWGALQQHADEVDTRLGDLRAQLAEVIDRLGRLPGPRNAT